MSIDQSKYGFTERQAKIATAIKGANIELKAGVGKLDSSIYEAHLPEGITLATVKEIQKYDSDFAVASRAVSGELSVDAFKATADLQKTKVTLGMGHNSAVHAHTRVKDQRNMQTGATTKVFATGTTKINVVGTKNSAAAMSRVVTTIHAHAKSLLDN